MKSCLLFFLTFFPFLALSLEIPKRLDKEDRSVVIRTLGLNSSTKMLSSPYPLGGYEGLELGVSLELINTKELARLGCTPGSAGCPNSTSSEEKELAYPRFSVGKGLYNNLDIFMTFALPTPGVEISDFGGQIRWNFYEARFLPIVVSALFQANQINFNNSFTSQNTGAEIIAGITVDDFSIYFGGGYVRADSQFNCGDSTDGTVDSADEACVASSTGFITQTEYGTHSLVGVALKFNKFFAAAQIDRYRDPVFSGKLGIRF